MTQYLLSESRNLSSMTKLQRQTQLSKSYPSLTSLSLASIAHLKPVAEKKLAFINAHLN